MKNQIPQKLDYDSSWGKWGEEFKLRGASSRHTRRILRSYMKGINFDSIIDIGCGTGILLNSLNLENKKVKGVDISSTGIKVCKKKMPKGSFEVMNIEKKVPKETYDLGFCSEVLEHIEDDLKAMKNLRKLCKTIIISVPSGKYGKDDEIQGHYRRYSSKEMIEKLILAGFKIIKYENWGFPFYSPIYRFLMDKTTQEQKTGKVTFFKKIISEFFYGLFLLNLPGHGDRLFVLAK